MSDTVKLVRPMAEQITGPSGKPTPGVLLNGHAVKLSSGYLYPSRVALLSALVKATSFNCFCLGY